jgi:hypothetical protein
LNLQPLPGVTDKPLQTIIPDQKCHNKENSRKEMDDTTFDHIYQPQHGSDNDSITREFEKQMKDIQFVTCDICKSVNLHLNIKQQDGDGNNICTECFNNQHINKPELDRGLPVWMNDNQNIHYELPPELTILT